MQRSPSEMGKEDRGKTTARKESPAKHAAKDQSQKGGHSTRKAEQTKVAGKREFWKQHGESDTRNRESLV